MMHTDTTKKKPVTGPLVRDSGKLGPQFPKDENPDDAAFVRKQDDPGVTPR
jgi:hypothetical protein